jgi:3-hydroxyacyl-CoA dehydrogenase/3-hydroxy-2-methylbutyryl-CoA dehydrogenase
MKAGAGTVVAVSGGASGLGEGAVRALAAAGCQVAILDLPSSQGRDVAEAAGDQAVFVPVDVTDDDAAEKAFAAVLERFGRLDVFVNSAGVGSAARVVSRSGRLFPIDHFRDVVGVNLIGTFLMSRHAVRAMMLNGPSDDGERGLIVNVASIAAFEGQIGQSAYAASKGGIVALTLPMARELGGVGIRVVALCPGGMDTPMLRAQASLVREQAEAATVFPKRLGTPLEFGAMVEAVMANVLLNGTFIRMDGGARLGTA